MNKTAHEMLLKLGWEVIDNHRIRKTYSKFDDKYLKRTMIIDIVKRKYGWCFTTNYATYIDKELATILLEYLDELEDEK